jgi:hypothetical protein
MSALPSAGRDFRSAEQISELACRSACINPVNWSGVARLSDAELTGSEEVVVPVSMCSSFSLFEFVKIKTANR